MAGVHRRIGLAIALWLVAPGLAAAQVIDFETIPGDVPAEGLPIGDQFLASHGVTFSLEGGGTPVLAEVGAPITAFQGPGGAADTPAAGVDIGDFFLTDDGVTGGAPPPLLITYENPTAGASGLILDVDGTESFLIEARDDLDAVLEDQLIAAGDSGTGDGAASWWGFQRPQNDIASIRIVGMFEGAFGFGLGFDDFNAAGICPDAPLPGCVVAAKAKLGIREGKPGAEKWKVKLSGFDQQTTQGDFGDPVDGPTRFDFCLYDDADGFVGGAVVARGAATCGSRGKPCWKAKGDKGYGYGDPDASAVGVRKASVASGPAGKGKIQVQAANNAKKGQTALPTGIAAGLAGSDAVTVQLGVSDGLCFEAALAVDWADATRVDASTP